MASKHFLAAAAAAALAGSGHAALDTRLVAGGLDRPVFATAPLSDGRVFAVERSGTIKVIQNGAVSDFLSIPVALDSNTERGLLGLAFDPGYADPASPGYRRFFVNYTEPVTLHTVIASYRRGDDPSLALPGSRTEVMRITERWESTNHKGGWIGFKPGDADHLYIGVGDGTQRGSAQALDSLLGKVLRIDVNRDDFAADSSANYGIPADNPFAGAANARGEIYAWGLRNPWRNSFDQLSGDLWIGDVGERTREEISLLPAAGGGGRNFGWPHREGMIEGPAGDDPPGTGFTDPQFDYGRNLGGSVIGGYVVQSVAGGLKGQYVFGDFVRNQIWAMPADGTSMADAANLTALLDAGEGGPLARISSFGEGAEGELYVVDYGATGQLGKVVMVVPEPGTWMMLAGGLALLGAAAPRLRRRTAAA